MMTDVGAFAIADAIQALAAALEAQTEENVRQFEIREPRLAAGAEASIASKLKYAAKKNSKTESPPPPAPDIDRPAPDLSHLETPEHRRERHAEEKRINDAKRLARVQNEADQPLE